MKKIISLIAFFGVSLLQAQVTFPVNGATNPVHTTYAFINAIIHVNEDIIINNGILLIKDGKIIDAAEKIIIPKDAVVTNLNGKHIYPSFIDLYSNYGIAEIKKERQGFGPQMESKVKGAYGWNEAIKSDIDASKIFTHHKEQADIYRKAGFGVVLTSAKDGIVRGSGALVNLNNTKENESFIKDRCAGFYSFNKGSSTQDYPSALVGSVALLRQTYYDAQWYKQGGDKLEFNISLDAFNQLQTLPSIFESNDKYNNQRAANVGNEFNVNYILKTGNNDYQRMEDLKKTGLKCIVPVNFPEAYDVEDPFDAENISLADLKHWEMAPSNPAAFEKNNILFCFTSADLKDKKSFLSNIRKAIQHGLSEKMALKALTTNPATFIQQQNLIGALKKGMYANFFISNKNIFEDDATIIEHWVNGEQNKYIEIEVPDVRGNYEINTDKQKYSITITGDIYKPKASVKIDTAKVNASFNFNNPLATLSFVYDSLKTARFSLSYDTKTKNFTGTGFWNEGNKFNCIINFISAIEPAKSTSITAKKTPTIGNLLFPFSSYGVESFNPTPKEIIFIKGATVWTNEKDSIIEECDVLITNGKISNIGKGLTLPAGTNVKVIDGKGKHVSAGIIDEHSHIALTQGVNEGTQASSAEVRMGDAINPEDINIYRQLAGGVTTSQLLHGSANPIGGQSALIKLRWGQNAEGMKFENADGFIKFALGENVKQSNWGDFNSVRFPQSRMGVEQVYMDYFTRAAEYAKALESLSKPAGKQPAGKAPLFRKDLELEALAEIINKKRFITCHSYVQSEINMLMHVADSFNFKVNTFTHILEGYKVADKMKAHGVHASTFADWWAYKNEVMEAIPYNAAILTKMGVNTSINSDDAEMGRRLNQEAAKSIKYGGLTEVQALKLVTLNPAKMLHIDDKVGSIKTGKSADIVIWSDNPLSIYAKVEKTIIDGKIYFDRELHQKASEYIKVEKARIIAKLLAEKQKGATVVKHRSKKRQLYHCNTIEGVSEEETGKR